MQPLRTGACSVKKLSRAITTLHESYPEELALSRPHSSEDQSAFVPRVLLAYDGTASAQQSLLHSEALRRWPEAVFLLIDCLPCGLLLSAVK